jgi:hypothetical protein
MSLFYFKPHISKQRIYEKKHLKNAQQFYLTHLTTVVSYRLFGILGRF